MNIIVNENSSYLKNRRIQTIFLVLLACFVADSQACELGGYESGLCVNSSDVKSNISFCADYLHTSICVPLQRQVWPEYATQQRDQMIREVFVKDIQQRLISEVNGSSSVILLTNEDCYYAYKKFLCMWNFPPCDISTDTTQSLCMSSCTSYFDTCKTDSTSCELTYQDISPYLTSTC